MSEAFIGEIRAFGFNFPPRGWAFCNGQLLSIAQNQALFSLLGTVYGGDGQTTFALPNLQSRVPVHSGQGPGLSPYVLGEAGGEEVVTLTANQMPTHHHLLSATTSEQTTDRPSNGAAFARGGQYATAADASLDTAIASQGAGGNQPHSNLPPYLALNYCIALAGIFPSRN